MTQILLIDLSGIVHPMWHTTQGSTNPNECSIQTVAKVRALASGQPHVAICADSGRSFRRELEPTYKAQRPESDATLQHQMTLAIETLKGDGFPVWAVKGFEADDLIASATKEALCYVIANCDLPKYMVTIASSDKDLMQLIEQDGRVKVHRLLFNGSQKAVDVDADQFYIEYGIHPNQMTEWLMLCGDSSDNIKGADGIGPKKATAMLQKFGNLSDLYAALDKGEKFQPATVKSLLEFRPRMEAVRALVTLRSDVPLPFEEIFRERVPADVAVFDGGEMSDESMFEAERKGVNATEDTAGIARPARLPIDETGRITGDASVKCAADPSGLQHDQAAEKMDRRPQSIPTPPVGQPHQSLAVREAEVLPPPSTDVHWQLEPRSLDQAITLAKHMHASRLFSAYGTPQAVLATIMAGRELGMQTQKALRAFHIIDGKPAESADLIRAQCLVSPVCEYFRIVERTPTKATWVTKRKGDPEVSLTYTIEEGRQAWQKDQKAWDASAWAKRPTNMVTKTASSTLARLIYPDVVGGLYCPEELTGEEVG